MLPTNPLLHATAPAGPHLPTTLLRQYVAGTLAPAAQHRVEAHTLACPRCADILAGLLQTPPTTTDAALAQLQQRLRQRVQQAAPPRRALGPRQHRWLALQLAAAAALLLGLVAGGWWAWQQRQASSPTTIVNSPAVTPALPAGPTPPAADNPAEQAAQPAGGYPALRAYLRQATTAFKPHGARRLAGTVRVRLHLGPAGQIEQAEAVQKLRPDYDAEAIRLLRAGPTWVPAAPDRQRAAQVVEVPVEFE